MVFKSAAALEVGISSASTTSFSRSGHCRSRNSSRMSKTLRADFVSPPDILARRSTPPRRRHPRLRARQHLACKETGRVHLPRVGEIAERELADEIVGAGLLRCSAYA